MLTSQLHMPDSPPMAPLVTRARLGEMKTVASGVTAGRTVLAILVGVGGVTSGRATLLVIAYAIYWFGDMADGWIARRMRQETRIGAVFDLVCDRACTVLLAGGLLQIFPHAWVVVAVFLVSFAVLDTMLSLAFLCWPIDSPNDYWRVDLLIYRLNWSPLAKAVNTSSVVGAILVGLTSLALALAVAVLIVKTWSALRVARSLV